MTGRIGLFGGVFDPVHMGHISIARSFLNSNVVQELIVLPSPVPPHKDASDITSFHHRLEMLKFAFKSIENIRISDLENRLPSPSYTLQTISYLQNNNPGALFYLCIGQDSLESFTSWHQYKSILDRITLIVAERPGYNKKDIPEELMEKSIFTDHKPVKVSSTKIRKLAGYNLNFEGDLPDSVLEYIEKHNLYRN
jgi:nicotinate-nucleotide adenylyltransferase